MTCKKRCRKT